MDVLRERKQSVQSRLQRKLRRIDKKIAFARAKKQRVIELYAGGNIEHEDYAQRSVVYDKEINTCNAERLEISQSIPVLHKAEVVDTSIKQYCHGVKLRLEKCSDFESKRQFLLDHIDKVVYHNEDVAIHGFVPILEGPPEDQGKIEFRIPDKITQADRFGRYLKYATAGQKISLPQFNGFPK